MPSAVPPSFGDAALHMTDGPGVATLPIGATLYRWRSAPEPTGACGDAASRSVRRLPGPFPAVVAPVSTSHRISLPTRDGYSSRSSPVLRDVARSMAAPRRHRQGRLVAARLSGDGDSVTHGLAGDDAGGHGTSGPCAVGRYVTTFDAPGPHLCAIPRPPADDRDVQRSNMTWPVPCASSRTVGRYRPGAPTCGPTCGPGAPTAATQAASPARSRSGSRTAVAERVGFEPTKSFDSTLFKSVAINRSATSPLRRIPATLRRSRCPIGDGRRSRIHQAGA